MKMRKNIGIYHGKCIDTNEWVEGFYSCVTDTYTPKNCDYITTFKKLDNGEIILTGTFEVISETVGEFTGKIDKNSNMIFEGNIVKVIYISSESNGKPITEITTVTYDEQNCCFYPMRWNESCEQCDNYTEIIEIEVIGNVYDNQELLNTNHI